jgi:hypothetical protein
MRRLVVVLLLALWVGGNEATDAPLSCDYVQSCETIVTDYADTSAWVVEAQRADAMILRLTQQNTGCGNGTYSVMMNST